jgi:hypothetical protein
MRRSKDRLTAKQTRRQANRYGRTDGFAAKLCCDRTGDALQRRHWMEPDQQTDAFLGKRKDHRNGTSCLGWQPDGNQTSRCGCKSGFSPKYFQFLWYGVPLKGGTPHHVCPASRGCQIACEIAALDMVDREHLEFVQAHDE